MSVSLKNAFVRGKEACFGLRAGEKESQRDFFHKLQAYIFVQEGLQSAHCAILLGLVSRFSLGNCRLNGGDLLGQIS